MVTSFQQIIAALPNLTNEQRGQLKGRLSNLPTSPVQNALVRERAPIKHHSEVVTDIALEALVDVARSKCAEFSSPAQLRKANTYQSFAVKIDKLQSYLVPFKSDRIELRAFLVLAYQLLYDELVELGISVSARVMMNCTHRLPAVVNRQFPGYVESGLLSWVILKEKKHVRSKSSHK